MLVDGKKIAADILESVAQEVSKLDRMLCMAAITCAPNFETSKYLEMKKQKAEEVGITLKVIELPAEIETKDVVACIEKVSSESDGIVVQLPLPKTINRDTVINSVSANKDPDGFHYGLIEHTCLPPVVGAIDEISKRYNVEWKDKKVVVLGEGVLVGSPSAHYAREAGAEVTVITEQFQDYTALKHADIIISGIGRPHFIKDDAVKEGVVIFDAGTSEDGGVLVGDIDPSVLDKVSLITPVPGGIGPVTVACLLRNLVRLSK